MRFALLFALTLTTSLNAQLRRVERDWIKVSEETFSLASGATRNIDISGEGKFRVVIDAGSPVALGISSKSQLDTSENNRVFFDDAPCGAIDVLKTTKECDTPTGQKWLTVFDQRNPSDKLLAALLRSGAMMDRSTAPNRVSVIVYRWSCIANCPLSKEEPPNNDSKHAQAE